MTATVIPIKGKQKSAVSMLEIAIKDPKCKRAAVAYCDEAPESELYFNIHELSNQELAYLGALFSRLSQRDEEG